MGFILDDDNMTMVTRMSTLHPWLRFTISQLNGWTYKKMKTIQNFTIDKVIIQYDAYINSTCEQHVLVYDCCYCKLDWDVYKSILSYRLQQKMYAKHAQIQYFHHNMHAKEWLKDIKDLLTQFDYVLEQSYSSVDCLTFIIISNRF